jgi:hypothetical protein
MLRMLGYTVIDVAGPEAALQLGSDAWTTFASSSPT